MKREYFLYISFTYYSKGNFILINDDPSLEVQEGRQIVNIYSCSVSPPNVNVERAVEIGKIQRERFYLSLPCGFYDTIKKKVITMTIVFDTDIRTCNVSLECRST